MYLGSYKGNITGLRKIARELLPDVAIEDLAIMSDDGLSIEINNNFLSNSFCAFSHFFLASFNFLFILMYSIFVLGV